MFPWRKKDPSHEADGEAAVGPDRAQPTKVLPKFLAALTHREAPVLLDLGQVVGSNVSFFGERLGCKIFVEDLYADLDRAVREGAADTIAAKIPARIAQADASVDGVLCWDLFDYLEKKTAQALGAQLARVLRPGGALLGFFATRRSTDPIFTRFVIADERTVIHRPYRGVPPRATGLQNRDIALLFPGMRVTESYLLLNQTREILLRR